MPSFSDFNNCFINSISDIPDEYREMVQSMVESGQSAIPSIPSQIISGELGSPISDVTLISSYFSDYDGTYFGHGTMSDDETIESIFQEGLKVKNPQDIRFSDAHLRGLDSTSILFGPGNDQLFEDQKEELENWPHKACSKILICELPSQFVLSSSNSIPSADLYKALYTGSEEEGYIIRPEFLRGYYDAESHSFVPNENYYKNLSPEQQQQLFASISPQFIKTYSQFCVRPPLENPSFPSEYVDVSRATAEWYRVQLERLHERESSFTSPPQPSAIQSTPVQSSEIVGSNSDLDDWSEWKNLFTGTTISSFEDMSHNIADLEKNEGRSNPSYTKEGEDIDGR